MGGKLNTHLLFRSGSSSFCRRQHGHSIEAGFKEIKASEVYKVVKIVKRSIFKLHSIVTCYHAGDLQEHVSAGAGLLSTLNNNIGRFRARV
eukprot:470829-Prorocentrum_minimum.AAC.12